MIRTSIRSSSTLTSSTTTLLQRSGLPFLQSTAKNPHANIGKWLLGCSGVVAGIVTIGGVTRLTKSGLSMTDWKPLGSLPPLSKSEWDDEFRRYQSFPEWEQRKSMSLKEFKTIYYWEWGHRMLGRFAGVCFAAPWAYFALRKKIPAGFGPNLAGLFVLGGGQGLVGWWMVRSGLGEDRRGDRHEIRVSPYRLAAHLGVAFTTFTLLLWTGLDVLQIPNRTGGSKSKLAEMSKLLLASDAVRHAKKLRIGSLGVSGLAFVTALSGAFVAGKDAGLAYNTFPKMDEQWIPIDDMIDPEIVPAYRNLFETTAMVQFNHRVLGCTTALSAVALAGVGLFHPASRAVMTPQVKRGLHLVGGVAAAQASLGIATLLTYVPIGLATLHQLGSLVLLSSGVYLVQSFRYASPSVLRMVAGKVVERGGQRVAGVGVMSAASKPLH